MRLLWISPVLFPVESFFVQSFSTLLRFYRGRPTDSPHPSRSLDSLAAAQHEGMPPFFFIPCGFLYSELPRFIPAFPIAPASFTQSSDTLLEAFLFSGFTKSGQPGKGVPGPMAPGRPSGTSWSSRRCSILDPSRSEGPRLSALANRSDTPSLGARSRFFCLCVLSRRKGGGKLIHSFVVYGPVSHFERACNWV